jgi:hypothetical protein
VARSEDAQMSSPLYVTQGESTTGTFIGSLLTPLETSGRINVFLFSDKAQRGLVRAIDPNLLICWYIGL